MTICSMYRIFSQGLMGGGHVAICIIQRVSPDLQFVAMIDRNKERMSMQKTTTFLMFVGDKAGKAEEAMGFYTPLFKDSGIKSMTKYESDEPGGKKGMVKYAIFTLQGQQYMAIDSTAPHHFTFTPSISIFIRCEDEAEIDRLYKKLSEAGRELMPLSNYGFSREVRLGKRQIWRFLANEPAMIRSL